MKTKPKTESPQREQSCQNVEKKIRQDTDQHAVKDQI